ncbi:hypothetical protein Tco_0115066 [Tanacetum coccineum]
MAQEVHCSTGFEGRIVGCKPNPTSFSMGRAVWHDREILHTPEQFSSELNNISLRTDTGAEGNTEGKKQSRNKSKSWKIGEIKDKVVNTAAGDSDDALVCCVDNTVDDRIIDSGASFHATYCKEELERFKLRSSFRDQQWKVTKGSLVVAQGNKRGSLYMVEVHPEGIDAIINGSGSAALWFGEAEEAFLHNVREDKETTETATGVANRIVMLKMVSKTPLQFGVAERLSRTFRADSTGLRGEALKMLWADSVSTTYLIYRIPYVPIGLRIPEEEWRGKDTSLAHLKTQFMEPVNNSIVAEHGLSSEITQSPGGSSDMSEGSENSGSFKDSRRSDKEDSRDKASSKEGGSETPQSYSEALSSKEFIQWKKAINKEMVSLEKNHTCSLVRLPAGKKALHRKWVFRVKEDQD